MPKYDCIKDFKMKLKPHQIKAVRYLMRKDQNGLLVSHPTGWGKTITALAFAGCFLTEYKDRKVIVVAPVSVTKSFKEYAENLEMDLDRIEIYSYQKFSNLFNEGKIVCQGNAIIVDEVHNLRNLGTFTFLNVDTMKKDEGKESGMRAKSVLECASGTLKRLLLTATPFVNDLKDFIPIINYIYGGHLIYKRNQVKNVEDIDKYLKKKVYYIPSENKVNVSKRSVGSSKRRANSDFPTYKEEYIKITMPADYERDYCSLIKGGIVNEFGFIHPKSFYNAHRRAVNKIGRSEEYFSLKIKKAVSLIKGNKSVNSIRENKAVIFSNWLEYGIEPIAKALDKEGISYSIFNGSLTENRRSKIIKDFNKDLFQVLILSSSGKEGIDLKGVRKLIVMDPVWNFAGMEQIRGRAIRYHSHFHLPENERNVEIYYLLLVTSNKKCISGDTVVYKFIEEKKKLQKTIDAHLKKLSI
jgi:superfamily II DNA or RNA helicase